MNLTPKVQPCNLTVLEPWNVVPAFFARSLDLPQIVFSYAERVTDKQWGREASDDWTPTKTDFEKVYLEPWEPSTNWDPEPAFTDKQKQWRKQCLHK